MEKNEMLLYRVNGMPSALAMFFLIFNTWQVIFTLNGIDVAAAGIRVMEIILLNIFLSFLVFIAASQIKRYSAGWSWAALGIGVFQCLRYFMLPGALREGNILRINIVAPLEAAGFFLIAASIWSLAKCRSYRMAKEGK